MRIERLVSAEPGRISESISRRTTQLTNGHHGLDEGDCDLRLSSL